MQSDTELNPQHICDNPIYECLVPSCTLDKFLCNYCFSSRYHRHQYSHSGYIQADITYNNDDKRIEELYSEMMLKQEASRIQMQTHVLLRNSTLISCLAVSKDGQIVACTLQPQAEILVYYLKKPTQMRRYWDGRFSLAMCDGLLISPNNKYLVAYRNYFGGVCEMILWNLKELHSTANHLEFCNNICQLSFSCDSTQIFSLNKTFTVWDCQSGIVIQDILIPEVEDFTTSTNFIYASTSLPITPHCQSIIQQLDKGNRKHVKIVCLLRGIMKLRCANSQFIIATQRQNSDKIKFENFKVIHVRTGKLIRRIECQSDFRNQTISYSLQSLQFAAKTDQHRVTKFCMSSLKEIKFWETSKSIKQIHLQEDGKYIYIVNEKEILRYE